MGWEQEWKECFVLFHSLWHCLSFMTLIIFFIFYFWLLVIVACYWKRCSGLFGRSPTVNSSYLQFKQTVIWRTEPIWKSVVHACWRASAQHRKLFHTASSAVSAWLWVQSLNTRLPLHTFLGGHVILDLSLACGVAKKWRSCNLGSPSLCALCLVQSVLLLVPSLEEVLVFGGDWALPFVSTFKRNILCLVWFFRFVCYPLYPHLQRVETHSFYHHKRLGWKQCYILFTLGRSELFSRRWTSKHHSSNPSHHTRWCWTRRALRTENECWR